MGTIANWGSTIKFEVSSDKILTFNNMKRTVSGRWQKHNILGKKPKSEFTGPEASGITMEVVLSAECGVKPRTMINSLEKAAENGSADYLYIGGKKVGSNKLVLESISETWDEIWNQGELVRAKLSLTFSEYPEYASTVKTTAAKTTTTTTTSGTTKKKTKKSTTKKKTYKVGDIVNFHGGKHYVSSYSGAKGYTAKAGKAKITAGPNCAGNGKAHPYHLIHTNSSSNVYGWVDEGTFD